jgi:radical SAM protein with 4Fe4S-binding SPASM domain
MPDELFRRIIDEFAAIVQTHPVRGHVVLSNFSEPFLDPRIFGKISHILSHGLKLTLQTNASVLFPRRVDRLLATGFAGPIFVSCHGVTPAVYRRVMGLDAARTLANLDYLISRYPRERVQIRAIPYCWPWGEVLRVKRYWQERGVPLKIFVPNSRTGLVAGCLSWRLKYPGERLKGCKKTLPLRDLVVAFDGEVLLCCEDMGRGATLGNLKNQSILEVWNSPRAVQVVRQVFALESSPPDFPCKHCEFGVSTLPRRIVRTVDHELTRLRTCLV